MAVVSFLEPAAALSIASEVVIQHYEEAPLDFLVEDYAVNYPFVYRPEERADLIPFQQPAYPNDQKAIQDWLRELGVGPGPTETYAMLDRINRAIGAAFTYVVREDEGVQPPSQTLRERRGSCRDYAALFIEACRDLGLASRFVSGYSHGLASESGNAATHAWAEVYSAGAGLEGIRSDFRPDHRQLTISRCRSPAPGSDSPGGRELRRARRLAAGAHRQRASGRALTEAAADRDSRASFRLRSSTRRRPLPDPSDRRSSRAGCASSAAATGRRRAPAAVRPGRFRLVHRESYEVRQESTGTRALRDTDSRCPKSSGMVLAVEQACP